MATEKRSTTFRLSEEARALLEQIAARNGISQTAVMELAIRQYARQAAIEATPHPDSAPKTGRGKGKS
jgi:predicted transcriptional regulator